MVLIIVILRLVLMLMRAPSSTSATVFLFVVPAPAPARHLAVYPEQRQIDCPLLYIRFMSLIPNIDLA